MAFFFNFRTDLTIAYYSICFNKHEHSKLKTPIIKMITLNYLNIMQQADTQLKFTRTMCTTTPYCKYDSSRKQIVNKNNYKI